MHKNRTDIQYCFDRWGWDFKSFMVETNHRRKKYAPAYFFFLFGHPAKIEDTPPVQVFFSAIYTKTGHAGRMFALPHFDYTLLELI